MTRPMTGLVLVLLSPAGVLAADFEVGIRLSAGDPQGSRAAGTLKLVAAPVLALKSGEAGTLLVGGQVPVGGRRVPVGREVEVTATPSGDGAVRVRVVLRLHSVAGAGAAPQVTTTSEQTVATVQPGGTVRVEIGKDPKDRTWADVTVRPAR